MLSLYFEAHPALLAPGTRFLHFAPEYCLMKTFERAREADYRTADLFSPLADDTVDLMNTPYPGESFDLVLCSHVLEHVEDDRVAVAEMHRILKPGGTALILIPVDPSLDETVEDATVTDPEERLRRFGQEDHHRAYGRDLVDRLEAPGFSVEADYYGASLPDEEVRRMRLPVDEAIYVCRKPPEGDDPRP
jgi:SAM-dependent methyltransferase